MEILKSLEDKSVNFVRENKQESRFVQRTDDYFIVYLSSHNGCNKACRFCHLTQTKQTDFIPTTLSEFQEQAKHPIAHYIKLLESGQDKAQKVNFNFMARGEPLANPVVTHNSKELFTLLKNEVKNLNLETKFNISTIGPQEIENIEFNDIFKDYTEDLMIYYSLYSVKEDFRKKWIPKSLPVDVMLAKLKRWQDIGGSVALHWAMIEGVNDTISDIEEIIAKLNDFGIEAKFNLVRYNPYSIDQGKESNEEVLQSRFNLLANYLKHPHSRIVPRVGFDVKASCGMFVAD